MPKMSNLILFRQYTISKIIVAWCQDAPYYSKDKKVNQYPKKNHNLENNQISIWLNNIDLICVALKLHLSCK